MRGNRARLPVAIGCAPDGRDAVAAGAIRRAVHFEMSGSRHARQPRGRAGLAVECNPSVGKEIVNGQ